MKPMPDLDDLFTVGDKGIFGTKMRSLIKLPGPGIDAVVEQQFEIARQILAPARPIVEPEDDIGSHEGRSQGTAQGRPPHRSTS